MKKHTLIAILLLWMGVGYTNVSQAQVDVKIKPTLTSRHYWRGIMVSNSVNIETDLQFNFSRFQLGFYGGYALEKGEYSEFDIHCFYNITNNLRLSIWDFYASRGKASIDEYDYFDFDRLTTNHLINADLYYRRGNSPISLLWSTFLWGCDLDTDGDQRYSSYFELDYHFKVGTNNLTIFAGANVFDESAYATKTAFVNVGISCQNHIKINDNFKLLVWAKVAMNPEKKTSNLIFGIGI
ncbi:hypothetical protein K5X82_03285 [Halosquirtibacter xylanolyticus]|uniref:hypothetical protein n=1 Tax=Halosquirtibacter xylanolyticus TaxID=3374599 RepID=UPI003748DCD6|nr:hypothetical protein K5X82_03285 [Prolixibacteraceae bacterium]